MKRSEIRRFVDEALAERGYSRGWYGWQKCWLEVRNSSSGRLVHKGKYASGISKKRLRECLSDVPNAGPPRTLPEAAKADVYRQTDLVEFIGEGRR